MTFNPTRSLALLLNKKVSDAATDARMIFGATCVAVNTDGTIDVKMRSVNEEGEKDTTIVQNIRLVGADVPAVEDLVVLQNIGAGRLVSLGRLRVDSTPGPGGGGGGGGSFTADWNYPGQVWPCFSPVEYVNGAGTISEIVFLVPNADSMPTPGRTILWDLFVKKKEETTFVSIPGTPQVGMSSEDTSPFKVAVLNGPVTLEDGDAFYGQITDPGGVFDLTMVVLP